MLQGIAAQSGNSGMEGLLGQAGGQAAKLASQEDKIKELTKAADLVKEAKNTGDVEAAMKKGVKGNKQLEDLVNPASQIVKQVKSGDKLEAAKTATEQAGKAVGGE